MKLRDMEIPNASVALEEAHRPRRPRSQPKAHKRAMTAVVTSISRAVAAGMTSTVVDVPTFVFGEPRFDIDDVTDQIRQDLEQRGYQVDTFPGIPSIAIEWGKTRSQIAITTKSVGAENPSDQYDIGL
jgi:precorrin-2 methylase